MAKKSSLLSNPEASNPIRRGRLDVFCFTSQDTQKVGLVSRQKDKNKAQISLKNQAKIAAKISKS